MEFYGWTILRTNLIVREIDLRGMFVDEKLCFCGSGKPYKMCHNKIKENTAMAYLFEAFRLIDTDIKNANPVPTCQKGCTECCHDYFEVSAPEFFVILMHLQKKHSHLLFSKIRDVKTAAEAVRPMFPSYDAYSKLLGKRILYHPCVFLDNRGGKCRIYEVRPLICRLFGYYSAFGNCASAKDQLDFLSAEIHNHASYFLSDTIINGVVHPPIAAPLVYWLGGKAPVTEKPEFKDLFLTAYEKSRDEYIRFSFQLDFADWFSV